MNAASLPVRRPNSERWNEFEFRSFHVAGRSRELNSRRDWNPIRSPWLSASPLPHPHPDLQTLWETSRRSQCDHFLPCFFIFKLSFSWHWWIQSRSFFSNTGKILKFWHDPMEAGACLYFRIQYALSQDGQKKNFRATKSAIFNFLFLGNRNF